MILYSAPLHYDGELVTEHKVILSRIIAHQALVSNSKLADILHLIACVWNGFDARMSAIRWAAGWVDGEFLYALMIEWKIKYHNSLKQHWTFLSLIRTSGQTFHTFRNDYRFHSNAMPCHAAYKQRRRECKRTKLNEEWHSYQNPFQLG